MNNFEPRLKKFLDDAVNDDVPVIYLTLGTEVKWQKWYIDTIWEGIKDLNAKFIFAIPIGLPDEIANNKKVYTDKWLPQIEILNHPAVKAGMHQCGFGGTLEFISAGIPVVVFPHFGDQPMNAENIVAAEIGVSLFWHWRALKEGSDDRNHYFEDPIFTASTVKYCFKRVLEEPHFMQNVLKMRIASKAAGGRKKAA